MDVKPSSGLKCGECDLELPTKYDLEKHLRRVHREERFKCQRCDCSYSRSHRLKLHVRKEHQNLRDVGTQTAATEERQKRKYTRLKVKDEKERKFSSPADDPTNSDGSNGKVKVEQTQVRNFGTQTDDEVPSGQNGGGEVGVKIEEDDEKKYSPIEEQGPYWQHFLFFLTYDKLVCLSHRDRTRAHTICCFG
jgi:hypothetical protein